MALLYSGKVCHIHRNKEREREMSWFKKNSMPTTVGNISPLQELKASIDYLLSNPKTSENEDRKCGGCRNSLANPYFSCLLCLGNVSNTGCCYICSSCYNGGGKFEHQHAPAYFFDHHELLNLYKDETSKKKKVEDLTAIAKSYYNAGSSESQAVAQEFFKSLDTDGDGRVDLSELLEHTRQEGHTQMRNPQFFRLLDKDNSGTLDFDESVTLYYIVKSGRPFCDYCGEFIQGIYFSCVECYENHPKSPFNLCLDCYGSSKCSHNHSGKRALFMDNYMLLESKRGSRETRVLDEHEKEMEELSEIAKSYILNGSSSTLVHNFFKSMDTDGDGHVNLPEFLEFMRREGHAQMRNPHFFKELDRDNNGTLELWEVITLYYIIKSGRPFCDHCGKFIPGIFFSCIECFNNHKSPFNLCLGCYVSANCIHNHAQFMDNYTLLEAKRDKTVELDTTDHEAKSPGSSTEFIRNQFSTVHNTTFILNNNPPSADQPTSSSEAIVPANDSSKMVS